MAAVEETYKDPDLVECTYWRPCCYKLEVGARMVVIVDMVVQCTVCYTLNKAASKHENSISTRLTAHFFVRNSFV